MGKTTKFKKITLDKNGKGVTFSFAETAATKAGDIVDSTSKGHTVHKAPHEHFVNAFIDLQPHLLFACELAVVTITNPEWFTENRFLDDERFDGITVHSLDIIDKEESKIRLYGTKTTEAGQVIPINTPIIDLHDESPERYMLITVLVEAFKKVLAEADQFFNKQKYAPNPQQEMEFLNS